MEVGGCFQVSLVILLLLLLLAKSSQNSPMLVMVFWGGILCELSVYILY